MSMQKSFSSTFGWFSCLLHVTLYGRNYFCYYSSPPLFHEHFNSAHFSAPGCLQQLPLLSDSWMTHCTIFNKEIMAFSAIRTALFRLTSHHNLSFSPLDLWTCELCFAYYPLCFHHTPRHASIFTSTNHLFLILFLRTTSLTITSAFMYLATPHVISH